MQIIVNINQTPQGNIEIEYITSGIQKATQLEKAYGAGLHAGIEFIIKAAGEKLGARATITGHGNPQNG
jgi:hypothetical protein